MARIGRTHREYDLELCAKEVEVWPVEKYINSHTPIIHECYKGHQWKVRPADVLRHSGCPHCSGLAKISNEEYIKRLKDKGIEHIPIDVYKGSMIHIEHKCIHNHIWKASPHNILSGTNCPECSKSGFDNNKPALLYLISFTSLFDGKTYYKLGITNRTPRKRYGKEWDIKSMNIIWQVYYQSGLEARLTESSLLTKYSKYCTDKIIKHLDSGNSEVLVCEIPKFSS
jgi:hypothetical protein